MLLGLDFLEKHRAILDLARREIRLGDQVIQARMVMDGTEISSVARVKVASKTEVLPQSSMFSVEIVDCLMMSDFAFQPLRDSNPCMMPASFHPKGGLAVVQLVNDTDRTIRLEEGAVVGLATCIHVCVWVGEWHNCTLCVSS
jgi:hypothetical protein